MSKRKLPFGAIVAIVVAIATAVGVSNKADAQPVAYPTVEAARFSVEVFGTGPDVILIPGLGCSRDVWEATVEVLKPHYRVHVLNIAGFAGEPAGANASGPVLVPSVTALHDYIAANTLDKPIIVGHSMGGLMALMLGISHPDDAGKLVIVDALPFIGVLFNPMATVESTEPFAARHRDNLIKATPEQFAAQQAQMFAVSKPAWGDTVVGWTVASDRQVFAQAMYDDMITDTRADLPKIKAPVVVYYPWTPGMYTAEQTDTVYATQYSGTAQVRMIRIDHSSHFIMLDQPEGFNASLLEVLK